MRFRFRIGDLVALKSQIDGDPAGVVVERSERSDLAGARAVYGIVFYCRDGTVAASAAIREAALEARGEALLAIERIEREEDEAPPELLVSHASVFRDGDRVRVFGESRDSVVLARDLVEVAPGQWAVFYHLPPAFPDLERRASTRLVSSTLVGPAKGEER